jgi:hypothetical protein
MQLVPDSIRKIEFGGFPDRESLKFINTIRVFSHEVW